MPILAIALISFFGYSCDRNADDSGSRRERSEEKGVRTKVISDPILEKQRNFSEEEIRRNREGIPGLSEKGTK